MVISNTSYYLSTELRPDSTLQQRSNHDEHKTLSANARSHWTLDVLWHAFYGVIRSIWVLNLANKMHVMSENIIVDMPYTKRTDIGMCVEPRHDKSDLTAAAALGAGSGALQSL